MCRSTICRAVRSGSATQDMALILQVLQSTSEAMTAKQLTQAAIHQGLISSSANVQVCLQISPSCRVLIAFCHSFCSCPVHCAAREIEAKDVELAACAATGSDA